MQKLRKATSSTKLRTVFHLKNAVIACAYWFCLGFPHCIHIQLFISVSIPFPVDFVLSLPSAFISHPTLFFFLSLPVHSLSYKPLVFRGFCASVRIRLLFAKLFDLFMESFYLRMKYLWMENEDGK